MNMTRRARNLLLWGALAATVIAAVFAPTPEEPVQPTRAPASAAARHTGGQAQVAATTRFAPQKRSGLQGEPGELFLVDRPPPAATAAASRPAPPPRPVAPPLPYAYMGKMLENGELTVFLTRNEKPYVVRTGDLLDGQYRVDAIRPPLVEFTYVPLDQKQTLNIGANK